jgi:hypothetical protein
VLVAIPKEGGIWNERLLIARRDSVRPEVGSILVSILFDIIYNI